MLYRRDAITYRLLDAFFRNWLVFVLCVLGVSSIVAVSLLTRAKGYAATASIRVIGNTEVQSTLGFSQYAPWDSPAAIHANRFTDLMQNLMPDGFVAQTLRDAKLGRPINIEPEAHDARFDKFRKGVSVGSTSKELMQISLNWDNKDECERLVRSLQQHFIEDVGFTNQADSIATVKFLDKQIETYRQQLEKAEKALMDYKRQNSGHLPDAQLGEIEQFSNLKMERDYLAVTSQDFAMKRQTILKRLKQIKPQRVAEQTLSTDPLVMQIRELQVQRGALIKEGHRIDGIQIAAVDKQIKALTEEMKQQAQADPTSSRNVTETKVEDNPEYFTYMQQLTQLDSDERTHKARIAQLDRQIAEYNTRLAQLPKAERMLAERTRNQEIIQKQYSELYERREQARLKADIARVTQTSKLIPQNLVRAVPTLNTMKKIITIVISVVVGLVVGFLMILLREWLDPSLRYETDVERLLGVPVLSALPESVVLQFPLSSSANGRALPGGRGRGLLPALAPPTKE